MDKTEIQSLVMALATAAHTKAGRLRASGGMMASMKRTCATFGPSVPVGDGNAKTDAPGTYRPVGDTCPPSCPFLGNGCYAQTGNVNVHQRRADAHYAPAVRGSAVAMMQARKTGRVARLHVSGDLGRLAPDSDYVDALCDLADSVNRVTGVPVGTTVAWTYTHHPASPMMHRLRSHGIAVRMSGHTGAWGAIVHPFADVPRLRRETGARLAKCPAQLVDATTCATCRLCWDRPDLTIVFDPHGSGKRAVTATVTG